MPKTENTKRSIVVICVSTAGWAFTFGLGSQLLTLSMDHKGWTDSTIGWNTSVYYLGIALAALFVPAMMQRWRKFCPIAGIVLSGGTLLLFPFTDSVPVWFGLRLINGMAGAMTLVPLETWISQGAAAHLRSRTFAFYAVALTLGGALGIGAGLPLYQPGSLFPFILAGFVSLGSALSVRLWLTVPSESPSPIHTASVTVSDNFLSYGSAWVQGFLEGGMIAFLPLYLLWLGITQHSAGIVMGVSLAGVIVFQVPAGWLADRVGRLPVLLGCYAMVALGMVFLPLCESGIILAAWLFLVGACSGAFYPLGLSLLSERIPQGGLARAYGLYMTMECAGCVLGPVSMGKSRDWFGEKAMFAAGLTALLLVLLPWILHRVTKLQRSYPPGISHAPADSTKLKS